MSRFSLMVFALTLAISSADIPQNSHEPLYSPGGCRIKSNIAKDFIPLIVDKSRAKVILPQREVNGRAGYVIDLPEKDMEYSVLCGGQGNRLKYFKSSNIIVRCDASGELQTEYGPIEFDNLVCAGRAGETVTRNGTCYNGFTKIDIAFPTYTWIEVCHNEVLSETLWAKHLIDGPRLDQEETASRKEFQESIFYPDINTDACYKTAKQIETIGLILGSSALANDYIKPSSNLFFSRGHLAPNGDGISAVEKRATFYFVNANPQWQSINGGNWNHLEINLRSYAEQNRAVLTVYTGSWGATTLKDINGVPREIWLGRDFVGNLLNVLPAPKALYKVVLNEASGTGVAIVQINNPYAENHNPEDILCESVCDQLSWVTWKIDNHRLGYTYCCRVADFYAAHPIIPNPGNPDLMSDSAILCPFKGIVLMFSLYVSATFIIR